MYQIDDCCGHSYMLKVNCFLMNQIHWVSSQHQHKSFVRVADITRVISCIKLHTFCREADVSMQIRDTQIKQ